MIIIPSCLSLDKPLELFYNISRGTGASYPQSTSVTMVLYFLHYASRACCAIIVTVR